MDLRHTVVGLAGLLMDQVWCAEEEPIDSNWDGSGTRKKKDRRAGLSVINTEEVANCGDDSLIQGQ